MIMARLFSILYIFTVASGLSQVWTLSYMGTNVSEHNRVYLFGKKTIT